MIEVILTARAIISGIKFIAICYATAIVCASLKADVMNTGNKERVIVEEIIFVSTQWRVN